ncbi:MAG: HlyD family efflux transporter periplasmic adaptor subunit, partial [Vibrio sp.]
GRVTKVAVDDGDYVEKGQVLVQLDPSDTQIALQEAEANLANAIRDVRGLYSNVDNYRAQVEAKNVLYTQAVANYERRKNLVARGAISKEDLIHYRDAVKSTKSELVSAQKALQTQLAAVDDNVIEANPQIKAAVAKLRQSYLNHKRSAVIAPVSGHVAKRVVQLGSQVQAGSTLLSVVPLDGVCVDANFKENQMKEMRIGQKVELVSDLYGDDVKYQGEIESLGIGTGSAFSLLPAQNASGNWIKIVQRVPVKIKLNPENLDKFPLRIGLSMVAEVDLHQKDGPLLAQTPPKKERFETDIYQDMMSEADSLVMQIMSDNLGQTSKSN